jgi:glucosamine--fructose-6-phosphate aminotransferase (isomerizing)
LDFGIRGTARNMLDALFVFLGKSVNEMARPVDAIKHQAKTVTVGTSRISEKMEGMLFEILRANNFKVSQLTATNIIVLKNLQEIVSGILGTTVYRVDGLNFLGEPDDNSTIRVIRREGSSLDMASRVEKDARLKGSKRIIVRQGNVYIGKGRKDNRSILCIPVISDSSERPNIIEHLVLLHVAFKDYVALGAKIKALGGKYEHIKNIVQENTISWNDSHLELVEISELFGRSAEKIGEYIVFCLNKNAHE